MGLEKPTFMEKLGRLWRVHILGKNVLLKTISTDPETGGYRIDIVETTKKELPVEAVHQTGDKTSWVIDKVKIKRAYNHSENGFSAIDLNLWLESNVINDALALKWNGLQGLNPRKMGIIIAGLVIGAIVIYVIMGGML